MTHAEVIEATRDWSQGFMVQVGQLFYHAVRRSDVQGIVWEGYNMETLRPVWIEFESETGRVANVIRQANR